MIRAAMDWKQKLAVAAGGDRAAREALAAEFYPRVRELVHKELQHDFRKHHRWIVPLFSTGDVVHEVFLGVLQGLEEFEGDDEQAFARYLGTLVHHRLIDAVRHHEAARRDARTDQDLETGQLDVAARAADPSPSLAASLNEQIGAYRQALAEFPERERLLLDLRLAGEETWAEIARRLGYPSEDAARKAFGATQARLLVKLRARGVRSPGDREENG
jgi:RNA polymerase sigma factor (sigma-70 family)